MWSLAPDLKRNQTMVTPATPNYLDAIHRAHAAGTLPQTGFVEVDVLHDDRCMIFRGGVCNCNPEVRQTPPERCCAKGAR
jgi:hypothetical protein